MSTPNTPGSVNFREEILANAKYLYPNYREFKIVTAAYDVSVGVTKFFAVLIGEGFASFLEHMGGNGEVKGGVKDSVEEALLDLLVKLARMVALKV